MTKQEEIREKQDKILNLVKVWAVIPHPYEGRDAEGLLYVLSKEEGIVIKVDRKEPISCEHAQMTAAKYSQDVTCPLLEAGYVAVEPLIKEKDATE